MAWVIESIEDTRGWDFDTNKPIPGSGDCRPCDHCGHGHEIHVFIKNGGQRMRVGSTCAKKLAFDGMEKLSHKSLLAAAIAKKNSAAAASIVAITPSGMANYDLNRWLDTMTQDHGVKLAYFNILKRPVKTEKTER